MTTTDQPVEPGFAANYRFPFDDFQLEAMDHLRAGESVMVAAPTSAGKTVVAEYALWRAMGRGERAIYTTPIKALSNQKRRELEVLFPGRVGLLTGDRSENRDAAVVVMTTEVLRNMLLEDPVTVAAVGCVVFDEVHYLADRDRGTIWEESIIACPPAIQLICLSATIANAEEIAAWIGQTHRPIALVRHDRRPVPLEHYAFTGDALRVIRDASGKRVKTVPKVERRGRSRPVPATPEAVVAALKRANLLPAIWFAFTRRGVELDAERCAEALPELRGGRLAEIDAAIDRFLVSLPEEDRTLSQISRLEALLRHGVGFHHAGILPPCKELVEDLFGRGFLSVVCATDTLSVGINMPARTVVISNMSRPVAGLLTPNDFSQLTGRAGRRGIDERGAVVLLPSPYHDFERTYAIITGPLEPVRSAFTLRYSTLLSVFSGADPEVRLATLVASSLRQFQLFGDARELERELVAVNLSLRSHAQEHPFDGSIEELDQYLVLQSRLSAAEKAHHGGRASKMSRGRRGGRGRSGGRPSTDSAAAILEEETDMRHSNEVAALRALLRAHPMHRLASESGFSHVHAERVELLRQRNRLLRVLETSRRERDRSADQIARAVSTVLRRLGYVEGDHLSPKAAGLREIVAPCGIIISEMYHEGMLANLAPGYLAEALSWFANDVDRKRYNSFRLPAELRGLRLTAESVFRKVSGLEDRQSIRLAQGPSGWFWGVALAWCSGQSIGTISQSIEMADGDIVSVLNKTVDLMDQYKGLLTAYADYPALSTLSRARAMLCRGMVAMIRTEGPAELESSRPDLVDGAS